MTVIEEETIDLSFPEEDYVIVATGPLTSEPLSGAIQNLVSQDYFHFFDAAAPIVTLESINEEIAIRHPVMEKGRPPITTAL